MIEIISITAYLIIGCVVAAISLAMTGFGEISEQTQIALVSWFLWPLVVMTYAAIFVISWWNFWSSDE